MPRSPLGYYTIYVNVNDPMYETMSNLTNIFRDAGWEVVVDPNSPVGDFTVTSPGKVGGDFPLVAKFVADTETSSWDRGIDILVYLKTYPTVENPTHQATTIVTGGEYIIVINTHGFVIVPPETQTYRFQYGTWLGLLEPASFVYNILPPSSWSATPLFFTTDRIVTFKERSEKHINPTKPTNILQTPEGEIYDTFTIAHLSVGRKTLLERERHRFILPLVFCIEWGEWTIPYLFAPTFFVEIDPRRTFYLPIASHKDFLKPRHLPMGRLVGCGELPPQGAILLALVP